MTLDAFNHAADIAIIDPTPESKNVFVGFIGEDLEMTGLTAFCDYQYLQPSLLEGGRLQFATSSPLISKPPHFFSGQLIRPRRTAGLLRGLMNIVRSRFHIPAAMLNRILAESDPVVTCSDDRLRFDGFSACCGAYARIDLLPDSVDGETFGRGTTNVDFNQPMLTALAKIRDNDRDGLFARWKVRRLFRNTASTTGQMGGTVIQPAG